MKRDYNGYALSYLSIKHLSKILSAIQFKNIMSDFSKIKIQIKQIDLENVCKFYPI